MKKTSRHTAIGKCNSCGDIIISSGGGRIETCSCGKSSLDQESVSALYTRMIGDINLLEVLCPSNCDHKNNGHDRNKIFDTTEELDRYMKKTYNAVWENDKFIIKK